MASGAVVGQFQLRLGDEGLKHLKALEEVFHSEIKQHGEGDFKHMSTCIALGKNEDNSVRLLVSVYSSRDLKSVETETIRCDTNEQSVSAVTETGTTSSQATTDTGTTASQTKGIDQGTAASQTKGVDQDTQSTQAQAVQGTVSSQTKVEQRDECTDTSDLPPMYAGIEVVTQTEGLVRYANTLVQTERLPTVATPTQTLASLFDLCDQVSQTEVKTMAHTSAQTKVVACVGSTQTRVVQWKESGAQVMVDTSSSTSQTRVVTWGESATQVDATVVVASASQTDMTVIRHKDVQTEEKPVQSKPSQTDKTANTPAFTQTRIVEWQDQDIQASVVLKTMPSQTPHKELVEQDSQTPHKEFSSTDVQATVEQGHSTSQTPHKEFSSSNIQATVEQGDSTSQTPHKEFNSSDVQATVEQGHNTSQTESQAMQHSTCQTQIDMQHQDSQTVDTVLAHQDSQTLPPPEQMPGASQTETLVMEEQHTQATVKQDTSESQTDMEAVPTEAQAGPSGMDGPPSLTVEEDGPPVLEPEINLPAREQPGNSEYVWQSISEKGIQTDPITIIEDTFSDAMLDPKRGVQHSSKEVESSETGSGLPKIVKLEPRMKSTAARKKAAAEARAVAEAAENARQNLNVSAPKLGLEKMTRVIEPKKNFSPAFKERAEQERLRIIEARKKAKEQKLLVAKEVAHVKAQRVATWAEEQATPDEPINYEPEPEVSVTPKNITPYSRVKSKKNVTPKKEKIQFFDADMEEKVRPRPSMRNPAPLVIEPLEDPNPQPDPGQGTVNGTGEEGEAQVVEAVPYEEGGTESQMLDLQSGAQIIDIEVPIVQDGEILEDGHIVEIMPVTQSLKGTVVQEIHPEKEDGERKEEEQQTPVKKEQIEDLGDPKVERVEEPKVAPTGLGIYHCPMCSNEYMTSAELYTHMPLAHVMPHYAKVVRRRRSRKTIILEQEHWEKITKSPNTSNVVTPEVAKLVRQRPRKQPELELTDSEDDDVPLMKRRDDMSVKFGGRKRLREVPKEKEEIVSPKVPSEQEDENVVSLSEAERFRCPICRKSFPKSSELYVHLQNTHKTDRIDMKTGRVRKTRGSIGRDDDYENNEEEEDTSPSPKRRGRKRPGRLSPKKAKQQQREMLPLAGRKRVHEPDSPIDEPEDEDEEEEEEEEEEIEEPTVTRKRTRGQVAAAVAPTKKKRRA